MNRFIETAVMLAAVCGFFGFIYPELCFIDDTYKVVMEAPETETGEAPETETGEASGAKSGEVPVVEAGEVSGVEAGVTSAEAGETPETEAGETPGVASEKLPKTESVKINNDIFRTISNAPPESIRIKSKLIEYLMEIS